MKRVCKQCGKSFELSESEIAFYKSKNLNLPKRCKACRQANKRGQGAWEERGQAVREEQSQAVREEKGRNVQTQKRDVSGRNGHRAGKWVYALLAASFLLLFGLIRISNWYFSPDSARPPVTAENAESEADITAGNENSGTDIRAGSENSGTDVTADNGNSGADTLTGKENAGAEELPQNETAVVEAASQEESGGLEETASIQEASETIQDSGAEEAVLQPEADNIPEQPQSAADAGNQYTFRNSKLLNEHFEKHGKEMGFSSAEEYLAAANAVVNNAGALHKTEKEDGDDVYYLEATNEFVIVSADGFIRTYFYPNAGIDYYNRQ